MCPMADGDGGGARQRDSGIEADCGGACPCSTCHVYVDPTWVDRLPHKEAMERICLTSPGSPIPSARA